MRRYKSPPPERVRCSPCLGELAVGCMQYPMERDYLNLEEIPCLLQAASTDKHATVTRFVGGLVARKMGLDKDAPLPPALQIFRDPERLADSWRQYLAKTPEMRAFQQAWRAKQQDPEAMPPGVDDMFHEMVSRRLVEYSPLAVADHLRLTLQCPRQPYLTNGSWDAETMVVKWEKDVQQGVSMPPVCHAFWAVPDAAFQTQHFGRIVLDGEELAKYVLWYDGLGQIEQIAWDNLVDKLRPGGRLVPQLEAFRFAGEKEGEATRSDLARELILPKFQDKPSTSAPEQCQ